MKTLKLAAVAVGLAALLSGQAFAATSASATVTMGGPVAPTCTLDPMTQISASGAALASGATSSAATVNLTGIADPSDATFVPGTGFTLGYNGMCNYAHTVRVQTITGNLKATNTANLPVSGSQPFVTSLNYGVNNVWAGVTTTLTANGVALKKSTGGVVGGANKGAGTLGVVLTDPAVATMPLIAGTWTDQIKIQIGAAL